MSVQYNSMDIFLRTLCLIIAYMVTYFRGLADMRYEFQLKIVQFPCMPKQASPRWYTEPRGSPNRVLLVVG